MLMSVAESRRLTLINVDALLLVGPRHIRVRVMRSMYTIATKCFDIHPVPVPVPVATPTTTSPQPFSFPISES